ncbi:hypothetical protein NPIL_555721 [Nephila pilipes]|uniref:Uncharacterized protein n=1 Tax=Nephila pilipes TaxID=299642 RepID=A0A8X6MRI5_NEPPI|nr:hypothetical protein NPIL_555721 [Nephila pilipes]
MSAASNSEDEDDDYRSTDAYIARLRKSRNIIDSWKWHKNPMKKTKRTLHNIYIHIPAVIGRAKNLTGILGIWDARDMDGAAIEVIFYLLLFRWRLPWKQN